MIKQLSICATLVALTADVAAAGELPTFELKGFPITPVQVQVVGPNHVQERSHTPTLTLGGMPVSPHQVAVLTTRPRTAKAAAEKLVKAAFPAP